MYKSKVISIHYPVQLNTSYIVVQLPSGSHGPTKLKAVTEVDKKRVGQSNGVFWVGVSDKLYLLSNLD